ncbi:MAG: ribonuclease Z [Pseudomonadales bacterium]
MTDRYLAILGTASQVPTRKRNHNGYFIRWGRAGYLIDPGEGTQRQLLFAGVSASDITSVFITHFHGDHCLGLPGIVQRLSLDQVQHTVRIYYPASGQRYFDNLLDASIYQRNAKIEPHPITEAGVLAAGDIEISSQPLDHTVESWGFRFSSPPTRSIVPEQVEALGLAGPLIGKLKAEGEIEHDGNTVRLEDVSEIKPGFTVAFVMDTRTCAGAMELARDADVLIVESTFGEEYSADAERFGHLTASQAAQIAADSGAKKVILTHFSQRYRDVSSLRDEATNIFNNVVMAQDGDRVLLV